MIRSSGKFVNTVIRAIKLSEVCPSAINHFIPSSKLPRYYSSNVSEVDPVALQMINYGVNHARSQRTDESYGQGLLVLEQCISSNTREEDIQGIALLAMSTLLYERGDYSGAMEKLEKIQGLTHSNLGVKVAAMEGLIGLNLEMGQDMASSKIADTCLQLLNSNLKHSSHDFEVINYRAKAIKGLVELVLGNHGTETYYGVAPEEKNFPGIAVLSHGEFLHASGKFSSAKEYYQKVIQGVPETESSVDPSSLATGNMVSAEVLVGASCALGQLEAHSGNFADAEKMLTSALTKAEEHFGSRHPKVGVVLTCIALMARHKAKLEHSSSILMQEGLYRKALDLLKAPPLEAEGGEAKAERSNIVALARGGYADILCVQQNRKGEGERMKNWAESTWKNQRLSLAEALEISEPSKAAVVDTRISRVL
ncbi:uncharacterized protein LOC113311013 isoform X2 [Papaver somniferum]|uniref:uncharacterized protein LOC113311013 isoform X2 n=1 Tax=Papaver somniferum TaxID=3469 RepID=UPI000E6F5625|nr:uncharacterized protein LOC113311013 isoform X2 [Papaver somniferum]